MKCKTYISTAILVFAASLFPASCTHKAGTESSEPGTNTNDAGRPNIFFIAIDDLNDWVGVFGGNQQAITPNIDGLAEKAVVFRNASCPGPVCCPSRSALLSGFMPYTSGVYSNNQNMLDSRIIQENATLPEYFSRNGYITISMGKIFHSHATQNGKDQGQWAFDVWQDKQERGGIDKEKLYSRNKGIINGKKVENPKYTGGQGTEFAWAPTEAPKEETGDYITAKWFAEKLQEDYDKPFFMFMGISKPHLPWYVPQEYFDMYGLDTIKIPDYREDDLDDIVNKNGEKAFKPSEDFLWVKQDPELFKGAVRAYLAATTYADECVGVALDALRNSKYAENTIIVLFGDHGWHLGEKLRFRKTTLWKESTQLPLVIYVPGMTETQFCERNVNLIDLYPTLIDLCGLPDKTGLDGKSIRPLLENPGIEWYPAITSKAKGSNSIIYEEWHYISYANGIEELYNIKNDPMEWNNLASVGSLEVEVMKKRMRSFLPKVNADPVVENESVQPAEKRNLQALN